MSRVYEKRFRDYLYNAPHKREKQESYEEFTSSTSYPQDETAMGTNFLDTNQLLNFSLSDLGFGSETAGLEYGIIGNMLQPSSLDLISTSTNTSTITSTAPINNNNNNTNTNTNDSNNNNNNKNSNNNNNNNNNNNLTPSMSSTTSIPSSSPLTTTTATPTTTKIDPLTPLSYNQSSNSFQMNGLYSFSSPTTTATSITTTSSPSLTTTHSTPASSASNTMLLNQQQQHLIKRQQQITTSPTSSHPKLTSTALVNTNGHKRDSVVSTTSTSTTSSSRRKGSNGNTPEQVYTSVKRPFNYAEGFHYLIQYVKQKMSREDLMRISRALALIRPSFLSLIMNLTEEDLVFMEKCIQRTLLEYEKLISFSGTPTVVWRRTGEVCLAGKEFSLLTQWTKDALLGKKTYIYELMDDKSAVEYWEHFSTYAFDNTDKACIYTCILRTPQLRSVPCAYSFTIKRDIFDLPSVIIGNFLPILS
ncbi:unnamed protein product [Cunninghamella blakesleeana]